MNRVTLFVGILVGATASSTSIKGRERPPRGDDVSRTMSHAPSLSKTGEDDKRAVRDNRLDEDTALTRARQRCATRLRELDDALHAARRRHDQKELSAKRKLIEAYSAAIARARTENDAGRLRVLRREQREIATTLPMPIKDLDDTVLYECVLGMYGRSIRAERYAYVNLRPPRADLWSDDIQEALRGKITFEGIEYVGTSLLVIARNGWYSIDIPTSGTEFRLNGLMMSAGECELMAGVYSVEIHAHSWGQPSVPGARATVRPKGSTHSIPFVNTGKAIRAFLDQRIDGRRVTEVSGYRPKELDLSIR